MARSADPYVLADPDRDAPRAIEVRRSYDDRPPH
jgi:hypothetical protein